MPKINPRIHSIDDLLGLAGLDEPAPEEAPAAVAPAVPADTVVAAPAPAQNIIQLLPPEKIRRFRKHPFRLYEGERLEDMIASITDNGILTPVIIRKIEPDEDGYEYEMLAGHNRQNVAIIIKMPVIPCIVKENLSDEDAWIYVIETNVLQRSFRDLLPSEKAAVLSLRYSKMFSQGKRNDIIAELERLANPHGCKEKSTSGIECQKLDSREKIGADYELKGRTVANYLRVNELISDLKDRVDNAEFPIIAAVNLSYLSETEQAMVETVFSENDYKLNPQKAEMLRGYSGKLTDELALQVISGEKTRKPKSAAPPPRKLKSTIVSKYFTPDVKQAEFERIVDEALALYFSQHHEDGGAAS